MEINMIKRHVHLRVSEILDERGLSTAEFARRAGLHETTAGYIVRDAQERIGLEVIGKICAALGVDPNDLFDFDPAEIKNGGGQ